MYIEGLDPGVSFRSMVDRAAGLDVTVLSNTTGGAWPVIRRAEALLWGEA